MNNFYEDLGSDDIIKIYIQNVQYLDVMRFEARQPLNQKISLIMRMQENGQLNNNDPDLYFVSTILPNLWKSCLIEGLVILDKCIEIILTKFQREKLNLSSSEVKYYSRIEIALKEHFRRDELSSELNKRISNIENYRDLRDQFAHFQKNIFCYKDKLNHFDSFLSKSRGILILDDFLAQNNGRLMTFMRYRLESGEFVQDFYLEGEKLIIGLTKLLLANK